MKANDAECSRPDGSQVRSLESEERSFAPWKRTTSETSTAERKLMQGILPTAALKGVLYHEASKRSVHLAPGETELMVKCECGTFVAEISDSEYGDKVWPQKQAICSQDRARVKKGPNQSH